MRRRATRESLYRENLVDALWRYAHQIEVTPTRSKHVTRRERNSQHYTLIDELLWLADYFPIPSEEISDSRLEYEIFDLLCRCRSEQLRGMPLGDFVEIVRQAARG